MVEIGNLVHVPCGVKLLKYGDEENMVIKYKKIDVPKKLLVLDKRSKAYKVLVDDEEWFVEEQDVYPV